MWEGNRDSRCYHLVKWTRWDVAHKAYKMWIRWIHTYSIKGQIIHEMNIPNQASWMVKKILGTRDVVSHIQRDVIQKKSIIRYIYNQLLGDHPKVEWRNLIFQNRAGPKAVFTLWLYCHGKLLTTDRLLK